MSDHDEQHTAATKVPVSGKQIVLRSGDYEAIVVTVGATLRVLTHRGRHLVIPFEEDQIRPAYRGATLAPWPNRIVDGRYTFAGVEHRLALTEPERGHALHGLLAWVDWSIAELSDHAVALEAEIVPQLGYPWRVLVRVSYSLSDSGLSQEVTGTNLSDASAPFGAGPHPYLTPGSGTLDDATLVIPANAVLTVTDDRLIPVSPVAVDAQEPVRFDFRNARAIGAVALDHAFTDLFAVDGVYAVKLLDSAGDGVAVTWDDRAPWVHVHTADLPDGESDPWHRAGLAVEPMTCPPDAFNTHHDLVRLEPGASRTAGWTISAIVAE